MCYYAVVRTTLDISDEAYYIAKAIARDQNRSLGRVVGDLLVGLPVQSDQFQGVHYMEKNAGYRLVQIGTFETFEGPAAVHSYQYDTEYRSVGQLIPDGDWVEFVEAFDRAEARR